MKYDGFEQAMAGTSIVLLLLAGFFAVLFFLKNLDSDASFGFWTFLIFGLIFGGFSIWAANVHGDVVERYRDAREAYPTLDIHTVDPHDHSIYFNDGDDRCSGSWSREDDLFLIFDAVCEPPPNAYEPQSR